MTEVRTWCHVYRLPLVSIFSSLPARMGTLFLNRYGALQSPERSTTMCSAAFLRYQKRRSEGFAFSKTTSSFCLFSRCPEWESSDIMIPLIHVNAVSCFFFSSVQESLFLGHYLMIPLITLLLRNITLSNLTYFILQSILSPAFSFQFPSKLFFPQILWIFTICRIWLHP